VKRSLKTIAAAFRSWSVIKKKQLEQKLFSQERCKTKTFFFATKTTKAGGMFKLNYFNNLFGLSLAALLGYVQR
jgi:hypothetical protein